MDDDLRRLSTLLEAPEPPPEVTDRSRKRLAHKIRRPRRHRTRWAVGGLGATAAVAAAVAVALVAGTSAPPPEAPADPPPARQILLAAATTADGQAPASGKYWHVKVVDSQTGRLMYETWRRPNGEAWRIGKMRPPRVFKSPHRMPFHVAGVEVSTTWLRGLPTTAAGLRAALTDLIENGPDPNEGKKAPRPAGERLFEALIALVTELPTPPKVRAAALRAFAAYPDVRSVGPVEGGQGLLFRLNGGSVRMVIDPGTARVRRTSMIAMASSAQMWMDGGRTVTITTGWTDRLPQRP